jgi:putative ABC transport system permease protein
MFLRYLDSLWDALRALRVNILRSVLTTLGIIIGVGAVIIMVSVGAGAEAKVADLIHGLGANLLVVWPGSYTASGVRLGGGSRATLTEDDADAIQREIRAVEAAAPVVRGSGQVVFGNLNWWTYIWGVTPEYLVAREWEIVNGRPFRVEEAKTGAKVALLGETVVKNLFPDQNPVGQIIRIRKVPVEVIGVLKRKGQSMVGQDQDDLILIPISTARQRVLGGRALSGKVVGAIYVKARGPEFVGEAQNEVQELLRQRHRLRDSKEDDFTIRNLSQILETRVESSRTMALLLAAVACVSLIVGGIGIMNIMLVSVTERTREIGLRMAVGARRRDILAQFLIEAVTLSMIGGNMGIALGVLGALTIHWVAGWPMIIGVHSIVFAFLFSAAVGIFFGFYPARKAARLDPIEALRYE